MAVDYPVAHELARSLLSKAITPEKAEDFLRAQAVETFGRDYKHDATLLLHGLNHYNELRQGSPTELLIAATDEELPNDYDGSYLRSMVCLQPDKPLRVIAVETITSFDGAQRKKVRRM